MKTHRSIKFIDLNHFSNSSQSYKSLLILSIVILTVPVMAGCCKTAHLQDGGFTEARHQTSVKLAVHQPYESRIQSIAAMVFNDDLLQKLECYQKTSYFSGDSRDIGSCTGNKILILCANAELEESDLNNANSFRNACSLEINLEDEDLSYPSMSATAHITAGEGTEIVMERLSSEIELRSICCDFAGKPYDGEIITDARIYLTNVNATCDIIPTETSTIKRIINHGSLIMDDVKSFKNKINIIDSIGNISRDFTYPQSRFLCFPNTSAQESAGTPFTRLVIEGEIMGETWYWPININRGQGEEHEGIERNNKYIYDITIRAKGTKDPDIPVNPEAAVLKFGVEKWKEKDAYNVEF